MTDRPSPIPIPPERQIYCSRTLNLRSIGAIGYDMDYTLVHYRVDAWEGHAYRRLRDQLAAAAQERAAGAVEGVGCAGGHQRLRGQQAEALGQRARAVVEAPSLMDHDDAGKGIDHVRRERKVAMNQLFVHLGIRQRLSNDLALGFGRCRR